MNLPGHCGLNQLFALYILSFQYLLSLKAFSDMATNDFSDDLEFTWMIAGSSAGHLDVSGQFVAS
jgi:hypothetical protein